MEKIVLKVEGMSCSHCTAAVNSALMELDGVKSAEVSLENKQVEVEFDSSKVNIEQLKAAIVEQGYDIG